MDGWGRQGKFGEARDRSVGDDILGVLTWRYGRLPFVLFGFLFASIIVYIPCGFAHSHTHLYPLCYSSYCPRIGLLSLFPSLLLSDSLCYTYLSALASEFTRRTYYRWRGYFCLDDGIPGSAAVVMNDY
ncbi:hypothetical protein QBC37DRAFT_418159 [Rhypophila decipiens]|uniref:Uncharacterized protein n=1 Tax=Rhypophila decipiens TaxID=261697 RepID=A0AAN6YC91_9PEZI|nr:hypothetical protein QBC37DRAFT_418159 [Rhypophila decipiens]